MHRITRIKNSAIRSSVWLMCLSSCAIPSIVTAEAAYRFHIPAREKQSLIINTMATDAAGSQKLDRVHVVMIGDSILDNGAYIGSGEHDVRAQVQEVLQDAVLPVEGERKATLLAVDGAVTTDVHTQLPKIPEDATHIVISVGGNDGLRARGTVATQPAANVAEALLKVHSMQTAFEAEYVSILDKLAALGKPILLLIPYNPRFQSEVENTIAQAGLSLYADVIYRLAGSRGLSVLDLRLLFTADDNWANAIEPSSKGGQKMALKVTEFVLRHV